MKSFMPGYTFAAAIANVNFSTSWVAGLVMAFAVGIWLPVSLHAQSSSRDSNFSEEPTQQSSPESKREFVLEGQVAFPSRSELVEALNLLEAETTQSLESMVPSNAIPSSPGASQMQNNSAHKLLGGSSKNSGEVSQEETVSEINKRIQLLRELYRDSPDRRREAKPLLDRSFAGTNPSSVEIPESPTSNSVGSPTPPPFEPVWVPDSQELIQPPTTPKVVVGADRVLPEPVNLFEMANSLFQTGNLQAALESYNAVDRTQLTPFDLGWLEFMEACCQRRLGAPEQATLILREIANDKRMPVHKVKAASNWLKYIESSKDARLSFEQLDAEINTLLKDAERHVNK